jgi:uncharacterized membrane protein YgaE (UPF0421/DUF939 family)
MSNAPRTGPAHRERWHGVREAVQKAVVLGVACLITYLLATDILSHVYFLSHDDEILGGMWAVIATVFVLRSSYEQSVTAALSRVMATLVSFALCLVYLAFLPFHPWALAVLVGASALAATLIGRPGDAVTAAITTTVVLVVAAVSPQHAWQQPILRLADTVIGVAVGVAAAWLELHLAAHWPRTPPGVNPSSAVNPSPEPQPPAGQP